ncbi:Uncharacterised protein [Acinetobacter baumannii]|nr:Uncharacterised protein [Acinetobacter baumannii]SSQ44147.1 Uncharacterised protein [Acinetobacter baumannii]SSS47178.1 Uncharacterised protein [Acinetobacter baumannii]SSU65169.1 Uncharacterised protein [Acinetobacter baumannii]
MATTGFSPSHAIPAASVTACCSAIATSKKRCGNCLANLTMPEPSHIAGVIASKRSSCAASSHNHSPNTSEYFGGVFPPEAALILPIAW